MHQHWKGLMVAPLTPMDHHGNIDPEQTQRLAQVLLARGAQGFYVCGSTGEGMQLTLDERMRLAEHWRQLTPDDLPLIVHVGHACLQDSQVLARHALEIGADAISVVGPRHVPVRQLDLLVSFAAVTAQAVPQLPFFFYFNGPLPTLAHKGIDFFTLAAQRIPSLGGIKFTHHDLIDLNQCLQFAGERYSVLFGLDEILLPALSIGASVAVGGTYNLLLPIARQLTAAFEAGRLDEARHAQRRLNEAVFVFQRCGGISALKYAMRLIGVDCGPARLPLPSPSPTQQEQLIHELSTLIPDIIEPARYDQQLASSVT
ncbi:MAG: dihydrodipicolinate synthase family protein [Phycisphaeraceae bacterium]|nr:dihydrodipicolinate synthase family protein [Phycisphaeraceae bacterium]